MLKEIYILGGGASGMFAAIAMALSFNKNNTEADIRITIIEFEDRLGKKILSTGNGHCNITNKRDLQGKYYASDLKFVNEIFEKYSNTDTMKTFEKLGLLLTDKNGYIYPNSMQASTVADTLVSYCRILGIRIITNTVVEEISYEKDTQKFIISTRYNSDEKDMHIYSGDYVIISCGTKAGIKNDYSDNIINSVKRFGHKVEPFLPALCSVYVDKEYKDFLKNTSGVRSEIQATLDINHNIVNTYTGELQLTDYGLSGIVIFQMSSTISRALSTSGKCNTVKLIVDFLPKYSIDEIYEVISSQLFYNKKSLLDVMSQLINKKLANALINLYSKHKNSSIKGYCKSLSKEAVMDIISFIKYVEFSVTATNDYLHSQICCGGVEVECINPKTMESNLIKGLYFSGECINVDGICGGYNLQWAWSTGYIAGTSIALEINSEK